MKLSSVAGVSFVAVTGILASSFNPASSGIVVEYGKTDPLCLAVAAQNSESRLVARGVRLSLPTDAITGFFGPDEDDINLCISKGFDIESNGVISNEIDLYARHKFDIDNDGKVESVYAFHVDVHAMKADIFFASPGDSFDCSWPRVDTKLLWADSPYIFPYAHGRCRQGPCREEDRDGSLTIGSHTIPGRGLLTYRFRYLYTTPFAWRGTTHFLLYTADQSVANYSVIVRTKKDRTLDEVCVFRVETPK